MKILHLIPSVGRESFGLGPVALNLALEQMRLGCVVQIWSLDTPEDRQWASENSGFPVDLIKVFPTRGPRRWGYSPALEHAITGLYGTAFDVIHQHGIWTAISRATCAWRKETSKPTCIVPHGSLKPWCLKKSTIKKKIAMVGYENRNFKDAACFHVLSATEMQDCRDFGLHNDMAIIENGVSWSWLNAVGDGNRFRNNHNIDIDKPIVLFLSRITPIKGLPMLFEVLKQLEHQVKGWLFLIGGVDEFNHQAECQQLVNAYGLSSIVRFIGPLFDDDKVDAFAAADLFILPSYSEGAPIVVLEALAAGVPVVTTKASPWSDLIKFQCGWWTDISSEGIAQAIKEATEKTREELSAMGENGKQLVSHKYMWQQSAEKTIALYNWLLSRSCQPDFVCNE
ncbi:MAG: glycosyltransferase [Armatimonadota bacterium]